MSGGFFRGTSAAQDTRFSNKQAKLLKTQKFAPELEHLVNVTKVKMDVVKPWIANRVTELLGFEDEVLINFIYGLLDGKEVNGKEVQISLTGFMEKNTGKFMKELWTLLISAQNNASGVPQQFLDAKEEETRKKKAETDHIADEIRRKRDKESRELEHEQLKKMDGEDETKNANADLHRSSERLASKASNARRDDREGMGKRNGMRGRNRRSRSRSTSKAFSNSRSHSNERRHRSRNISRSPRTRERSVPPEMVHRSRKRSLTPRESRFPPRQRSSYYRRRSRSRSVSPIQRSLHSPIRYRSRSPVRRRSVTPVRRRRSPSPLRRRSPSPMWRRAPSPNRWISPSPKRQRSPSPNRRRSPSPNRRRSPIQRESPSSRSRRSSSLIGQKSYSPMRRRSPLAMVRRSPSPMRHRSKSPVRRRLRSPVCQRSPSLVHNRSLSSPARRQQHRSRPAPRKRSPPEARGRSPVTRHRRSMTPSRRSSEESSSPSHVHSHSLSPVRRSPRRYPDQSSKSRMRSSSLEVSPAGQVRNQVMCDRHLDSLRGLGNHRQHDDSLDSREQQKENYNAWDSEDHVSNYEEKRSMRLSSANKRDDSTLKGDIKSLSYPERESTDQTSGPRGHSDSSEIRNKDRKRQRERNSGKEVHSEISDQMSRPLDKATLQGEKEKLFTMEGKVSENKNHARSDVAKDKDKPNIVSKPLAKVDDQQGSASLAAFEESEKHRYKLKERRNKRLERHETDSESESYFSEAEERKEAKRRRKEDRRLRKEERRRRREERRCRKEERRMEKLKVKSYSIDSSPLDNENHPGDVDSSDCEQRTRKESRAQDEERGKEQKKLETELRMKAVELFKAKKGSK